MSDVNKLDNKQCPFDPEQYKAHVTVSYKIDNDVTAPIGSFPWAIIQVYVGKLVRRNGWDAQVEYIKLLPGSTGNNALSQIEVVDKKGATSWQPTQEDMMACDWDLVEIKPVLPEGTILSFDLTLGYVQYYGSNHWGFAGRKERFPPFGNIDIKYNEHNLSGIAGFYWADENTPFNFDTVDSEDEFFEKTLLITVDGITYNLGKRSSYGEESDGNGEYYANGYSDSDDAQKLSTILKQTGQTKTFYIRWVD